MAKRSAPPDIKQRTKLSSTYIESPIGTLFLVKSLIGLRRIAFENEDLHMIIDAEERETGCGIEIDHTDFDHERNELAGYFAGTLADFTLTIDLPITDFSSRAQHALATIPVGQTRSYAQLAAMVGAERAARAAGTACRTNPLPLILPCHRIVPSSGGVGQYSGLPWRKEFLLAFERRAHA